MLIQGCSLSTAKKQKMRPNVYGPAGRDPPIVPVTVVGEAKVGKTSIIRHFRRERFSKKYTPTVGVEKSEIVIDQPGDICDDKIIFRFLDTNDNIIDPDMALNLQDRVDALHASFSRYVLVVYDITDHKSFEATKDWVRLMRNMIRTDVTFILVGNKTDQEQHREVHTTAGEVCAILHDMLFVETSAKDGNNLQDLFEYLTSL